MKLAQINIRDPFILCNAKDKTYYMYGTFSNGTTNSFSCFTSNNLEDWNGPYLVFEKPSSFDTDGCFWAPEVYQVKNRYFMLATFRRTNSYKFCQFLVSDSPKGPFLPYGEQLTPKDEECLDATLYFDEKLNRYFILYVHEWIQIDDGELCSLELSDDFTHIVGNINHLFNAREANWAIHPKWSEKDVRVFDGPFIYKKNNQSLLLWSSFGKNDYETGLAKAVNDNYAFGPYEVMQSSLPLIDSGHAMIFTSFGGVDYLCCHQKNSKANEETPLLLEVDIDAYPNIIK